MMSFDFSTIIYVCFILCTENFLALFFLEGRKFPCSNADGWMIKKFCYYCLQPAHVFIYFVVQFLQASDPFGQGVVEYVTI
jgi:hypothetical protein